MKTLFLVYLYNVMLLSVGNAQTETSMKNDIKANEALNAVHQVNKLKKKRSIIYPNVHSADEGYISDLIQPQITKDGMTMVLANQKVDIASPHFEELLLKLYTRIQDQINDIKDKKIAQNLNVEFNENIFQFVKDFLIPSRFNAFKVGDVASNDYVHLFHKLIMRKLYIALANAGSRLVPSCWKNLSTKDTNDIRLNKQSFKRHGSSIPWNEYNCDEFFESPFPDLSVSYIESDDVDLSAPRLVTSEQLQIRGHSYYDVKDVEYTEDAILRFNECMRLRLDQMTDPTERDCFIQTYLMNMNYFIDQMQVVARQNSFDYSRLKKLKVPELTYENEKNFLPKENKDYEDYIKSQILKGRSNNFENVENINSTKPENKTIKYSEGLKLPHLFPISILLAVLLLIAILFIVLLLIILYKKWRKKKEQEKEKLISDKQMAMSTQTPKYDKESKKDDLKMMFVDPVLYETVPGTFKDLSEGVPKYYSGKK